MPQQQQPPKIDQYLDAFKEGLHKFSDPRNKSGSILAKVKDFTLKRVKAYGICGASLFVAATFLTPPLMSPFILGGIAVAGAANLYARGSRSLPYQLYTGTKNAWKTALGDVWNVATLPVRPLIWGAKKIFGAQTGVAPAKKPEPAPVRQQMHPDQEGGSPISVRRRVKPAFAHSAPRGPANANTQEPILQQNQRSPSAPGIKPQ